MTKLGERLIRSVQQAREIARGEAESARALATRTCAMPGEVQTSMTSARTALCDQVVDARHKVGHDGGG